MKVDKAKSVTRRSLIKSAGVVAAAPALGAVCSQASARDDIRIEEDIVFAKGGDMDLPLDIYHPAPDRAKRMAIVHCYGGGFFTGNKRGVSTSCRAFAALGYTGIASTYRLRHQGKWPAQIEDVKAAIRWTRANADRLDIDPGKIGVAGYSAGGMLALFAAGTNGRAKFEEIGGNNGVSADVAACVAFYPSVSASPGLFREGQATPKAIAAASPTSYISGGFAPTIFLHGMKDTTIPYTTSLDFFTRLHEEGVKVDLHLIQGAPHAYEGRNVDAALASAQAANLFLDRVVVNPTEYPPFGHGRRGPGRRQG